MPSIKEFDGISRRVLNVFYLLDTSGSMQNAPIAQLNCAMRETAEAVRNSARNNADAQIRMAVLEFNSNVRWMQPKGPENIEDFEWEDLTAGGLTNVGKALNELDSKLSRNAFLESIAGNYLPVIIFMSDGYATDEYKTALAEIRKNKWFLRATKVGFAIGDDPDINMISDVVGNSEAVIRTNNLETFGKLLQFASVSSSMLASSSRTSSETLSGADIIDKLKEETGGNDDFKRGDEFVQGGSREPEPPIIDVVDDDWI